MIKHSVFIVLLFCSIISSFINAQPSVNLDDADKSKINEHNLWFQTKSLEAGPSFVELIGLYQNGNRVISTLGGSGAYVTKVDLTNLTEKGTWFVSAQTNFLDIGTAYWQPSRGKAIRLESFGQIASENPKLAHSQAFSLLLEHEESGTLWVFIQAKMFATPVEISLYSKTEFYRQQFFTNSITSISFTVMVTLALIALFIYIRTRYLVTLACAGYIGLHGLGWFAASGSLGHLFQVSAFNPVYAGIMIFPFAIASASQFTKLLFNCQHNHHKLAKIFNILTIICVFFAIVMPFLPFTQSYLVSHIIAITWIPLSIGTGFFMLVKKDFRAKYYLAGNLLYGLALALYVVSHLYKLDNQVSPELVVLYSINC